MAVSEALFGEEGSVTIKAPRTNLLFNSANVTNADDTIQLDKKQLYVTGHKVQLTVSPESGAALPAPLMAATDYFVIVDTTDTTGKTIKLAATEADALAGTAITLTDDGTGIAHNIQLAEFDQVLAATNWTITVTKAKADATTLNSSVSSYKGGLVDATGSMTVLFEDENTLTGRKQRKILDAITLAYDDGDAVVELYSSDARKIVANVMLDGGTFGSTLRQLNQYQIPFSLNGSLDVSSVIA